MSKFRSLALPLALLFATACGGSNKDQTTAPAPVEAPADPQPVEATPAPQPAGEDLSGLSNDELAERVLSYFDEIGAAAAAAEGDCTVMAENLERLAEQGTGAAIMTEGSKRDATMTPEEKQAFEQKYSGRLMEKMGPVMQNIMACQNDPAVMQAVQKLLPEG